jgi:hypothetical protein
MNTRTRSRAIGTFLALTLVAVLLSSCGGGEPHKLSADATLDAGEVRACLRDDRLEVEYVDLREESRGEVLEVWQGKWFVARILFAETTGQAAEWRDFPDDRRPEQVRNVLITWPHVVPKYGLDRVEECIQNK